MVNDVEIDQHVRMRQLLNIVPENKRSPTLVEMLEAKSLGEQVRYPHVIFNRLKTRRSQPELLRETQADVAEVATNLKDRMHPCKRCDSRFQPLVPLRINRDLLVLVAHRVGLARQHLHERLEILIVVVLLLVLGNQLVELMEHLLAERPLLHGSCIHIFR